MSKDAESFEAEIFESQGRGTLKFSNSEIIQLLFNKNWKCLNCDNIIKNKQNIPFSEEEQNDITWAMLAKEYDLTNYDDINVVRKKPRGSKGAVARIDGALNFDNLHLLCYECMDKKWRKRASITFRTSLDNKEWLKSQDKDMTELLNQIVQEYRNNYEEESFDNKDDIGIQVYEFSDEVTETLIKKTLKNAKINPVEWFGLDDGDGYPTINFIIQDKDFNSLKKAFRKLKVKEFTWTTGHFGKEWFEAESFEAENCLYEDNEDEAWALATMNEDKWFCKQPTCEFCKDRPWEYRWNNNEKVLCCCSEPTREADFCPQGGYNRSGDECKFQCGHEECEAEMKAKYGSFKADGSFQADDTGCECEEGEDCEDTCSVCVQCGIRTQTAHTPFADERFWPDEDKEERIKAAASTFGPIEDKGCDYCGEWVVNRSLNLTHNEPGVWNKATPFGDRVFVPRFKRKSFNRAESFEADDDVFTHSVVLGFKFKYYTKENPLYKKKDDGSFNLDPIHIIRLKILILREMDLVGVQYNDATITADSLLFKFNFTNEIEAQKFSAYVRGYISQNEKVEQLQQYFDKADVRVMTNYEAGILFSTLMDWSNPQFIIDFLDYLIKLEEYDYDYSLQFIRERGVDINEQDDYGVSLKDLMLAENNGYQSMLEELVNDLKNKGRSLDDVAFTLTADNGLKNQTMTSMFAIQQEVERGFVNKRMSLQFMRYQGKLEAIDDFLYYVYGDEDSFIFDNI